MDPITTPTPAPTAPSSAVTSMHLPYPDSLDSSSPRSRASAPAPAPDAAPWAPDLDPLPGAKLRLMCSYGGHIVPRPHDKSLCYVGGETRIVVVDRHSSLSSLSARLSKTLLHGRPFALKYQLPSEDLDSLVSVATDEDLDNMIDEYDRTVSATSSPLARPGGGGSSRLRLFLFFVKPETAASMGALLDDAKSETWFVDALNGSGLLPRGLSDSAVEECLLSLDAVRASDSCNDLSAASAAVEGGKPDSPQLVENDSSFGSSSSSSPSTSNLPPIRVRVGEEPKGPSIEEQFAQISFSHPSNVNPMVAASGENFSSKVLSDDERSDHGGGVGFRKPPLPLHPVQMNKGGTGGGGYGLPSPDSVASDTSISSASSHAKPSYYQDQQQQQHYAPPRGAPSSPNNNEGPTVAAADPGLLPQFHQPKDPNNYLDQHLHHQCMHHHHHTMTTPTPTPTPTPHYYQLYSQPPTQQYHHALDQQYYVMPVAAATQAPQSYNISAAAAGIPPVYPAKAASPAPTNPSAVHYVGFSHHPPSQSIAVAAPPSGGPNYAYEYANPAADQHVFYSHHVPAPAQYQSMTPAAAMALSEAAKQLPQESGNAQPQMRTS